MAGGGGSTGGIGAQSPAVNPPNPMGQIGNAVGGALVGMGGQSQNPMGGGNFVQTGQFGSQPIDMGGGFGGNMGGFGSNMGGGFGGIGAQQQMQQAQQAQQAQQVPMGGGNMGGGFGGMGSQQQFQQLNQQGLDLSKQMDAYMQTSPAMKQMQDLQAKIQSGQLTPEAGQAQGEALNAQLRDYQQQAPMLGQLKALGAQINAMGNPQFLQQQPAQQVPMGMLQAGQMSPEMQQANAQRAFDQRQSGMGQQQMPSLGQQQQGGMGRQPTGQMAGLGALLGGMPNQPTPAAQPAQTPTAKPAPVAAKPAPVAAKPSVVPPRTPPAVARAIQKLAAKKPMMRR